ncbi:TOM1-like protein 2 [Impatiens glandulifera]|uniref:TOM1-like protein 2 n=1 Tax=Impatiens glandulifera TaxID=253017 RepID=UPI001FB144E1|nr:TOM1-like protein 2 [Impatiens glandulifera]
MEKFKLASSSLGDRLKTGSAQMGRIVSAKMKEILQAPTPESKMVDDATSEHLEEPNWGLNLRICSMISSEEINGNEVVKAIKRKLAGKVAVSQMLSLELLELCSSNCEKVFSEVASEKILDEMVRMIEDPKTDQGNKIKALGLIEAWGDSQDLKYLPVFHQTLKNLKIKEMNNESSIDETAHPFHSLESYMFQEPISPPERYPYPSQPELGLNDSDQSSEEKKEALEIARNSHDILSSIVNSPTGAETIKDDLTVKMVEKCKHSLSYVQMIAESTIDDEAIMFEALNLHDQLGEIISKYEAMDSIEVSDSERSILPESSNAGKAIEMNE